MRASVTKQYNW